jgi:hypothetical protein
MKCHRGGWEHSDAEGLAQRGRTLVVGWPGVASGLLVRSNGVVERGRMDSDSSKARQLACVQERTAMAEVRIDTLGRVDPIDRRRGEPS